MRGLLTPRDDQVAVDARDPRPGEHRPPEAWTLDAHNLDRPGNRDIQLDIFYDYRLNIPEYETFQHYLRVHQPPTLVTWGKGDEIFGPGGAEAYKRDLPNAEVHLLETGHFALEDDLEFIADTMRRFLRRNIDRLPPDVVEDEFRRPKN